MFGWLKPTCPVSVEDKNWVEQRLAWIIDRFGRDRVLKAPRVLPTKEFFPGDYLGNAESVTSLFGQVCRYMGTDSSRFHLATFTESDRPDALGLYDQSSADKPIIWLLESTLQDQEEVIGTISHEVAHDLLLGSGLLTGTEPDHENVTDLLMVALGMGTFHANTAVRTKSENVGNMNYWSIRKRGYLTASVCGYAMGVVDWLRRLEKPSSTSLLGADAAGAMVGGHRYLAKTNDCLIDREQPEKLVRILTNSTTERNHESASRCLHALQTWFNEDSTDQRCVEIASGYLTRKEPAVQVAAIRYLAKNSSASRELTHSILSHLNSSHASVQIAATQAVETLKLPADSVTGEGVALLEELSWLVKSDDRGVSLNAAIALGQFGPASLDAVPLIARRLVRSLAETDDSFAPLLESLTAIVGNVSQHLKDHPDLLSEGHTQLIEEFINAERMAKKPRRTGRWGRRT